MLWELDGVDRMRLWFSMRSACVEWTVLILLSDPRVLRVPVADCGEPLVEMGPVSRLRLDSRERDADGAYGRVRAGVLERSATAAALLPDGVELLVIEGHRTIAEQARRFSRYEQCLRGRGVTDALQLRERASEFVAPVEVAPHCAGAAVDVTLADASGELDMGGPVNGHRVGCEHTCRMDADVSVDARANRDLLAEVMTAAGFQNYPTEWWHWSFGDRYWAAITGAKIAIYGPI